jgi:hypothetical protein
MTSKRWASLLTFLTIGAAVIASAAPPSANAAPVFPNVTVRMTILELEDFGNDLDSVSDTDFYVMTTLDDRNGNHQETNNEDTDATDEVEGEEHIYPNWEISYAPVTPNSGQVDLTLTVKDEDGGFNFKDDTADITPGGVVRAVVDLRPCRITIGTTAFACGAPITQQAGDKVVFKVDVLLPPSTPGLRMQCLHEPIWPQPGEIVTITANTLDGAANPKAAADFTKITFNGVDVVTKNGAPQAVYKFPAGGSEFWYECTAEDNGGIEAASTSPRMVRVGVQKELAVPILMTGPSNNRVDIVILADKDSYTSGPATATFLKHVHDVLLEFPTNPANQRRGYFANEYVLTQQHGFNIWLATDAADADEVVGKAACRLTAPENWDKYTFADAGWIIHSDDFRDCAQGGLKLFSSEQDEPGTSVHETGHSPFGLADEYCCDGGYSDAPNLFSTQMLCAASATTNGIPTSDCRSFTSSVTSATWWTSDPAADVMGADRTTFNRLDRLRWNSFISDCLKKGGC